MLRGVLIVDGKPLMVLDGQKTPDLALFSFGRTGIVMKRLKRAAYSGELSEAPHYPFPDGGDGVGGPWD